MANLSWQQRPSIPSIEVPIPNASQMVTAGDGMTASIPIGQEEPYMRGLTEGQRDTENDVVNSYLAQQRNQESRRNESSVNSDLLEQAIDMSQQEMMPEPEMSMDSVDEALMGSMPEEDTGAMSQPYQRIPGRM